MLNYSVIVMLVLGFVLFRSFFCILLYIVQCGEPMPDLSAVNLFELANFVAVQRYLKETLIFIVIGK